MPASPTLKPKDQTRTAVAEITPSVTNTDTAVPASPTNIPATPTNSVTPSITHTETIPASPTKDRDATRTAQAEDKDATRTAQAIRKTPTSTNTDTPEPTQEDTPEPTQEDTPEPTQEDTPEPTSSPIPSHTATNTKPKPTNPVPTYNPIIKTFTPTTTKTATQITQDLVSASPTGTAARQVLEQIKPKYEIDSISPYVDIYSSKARQDSKNQREFYSLPEQEIKFMRAVRSAQGRTGTGEHLTLVYPNILRLQENLTRSASNEDSKKIIETYKRQLKEWDEMPKEYRAELEEIIRNWESTQREIDLLLQQIRSWEEAHKAHIKLYEAQRKQWLADRNRKPNSGNTYRPIAVAE